MYPPKTVRQFAIVAVGALAHLPSTAVGAPLAQSLSHFEEKIVIRAYEVKSVDPS
jgi:hypothetical protein